MPVEVVQVHLKPSGFFDRNPGLDVPSVVDMKSRHATEAAHSDTASTKSVDDDHPNGTNVTVNGSIDESSCCSTVA